LPNCVNILADTRQNIRQNICQSVIAAFQHDNMASVSIFINSMLGVNDIIILICQYLRLLALISTQLSLAHWREASSLDLERVAMGIPSFLYIVDG